MKTRGGFTKRRIKSEETRAVPQPAQNISGMEQQIIVLTDPEV